MTEMNNNISRLGVFAWFGYRLHMIRRAELIKRAGFAVTALWWGDEEKENTGSLHDLPPIVRNEGLSIDNIHAPFANSNLLWSLDSTIRQNIFDEHLAWLDDCARHEIGKMIIHLTTGPNPPKPNSRGLEVVKQIAKTAEELGIVIAVENTRSNEHIDFVLSEIDSPNLTFCYDSSHDFLWNTNPAEILAKWGNRLAATHLSNNDGAEDRHWPIHQGVIDWQKITQNFPKKTYSGAIMLEILPNDSAEAPGEFLKSAYYSLISYAKNL